MRIRIEFDRFRQVWQVWECRTTNRGKDEWIADAATLEFAHALADWIVQSWVDVQALRVIRMMCVHADPIATNSNYGTTLTNAVSAFPDHPAFDFTD